MPPFGQSIYCSRQNSTEELSLMKLKRDIKCGEESTNRFEIAIRNLTNFDLSTQKSQRFYTLMGSFWVKYILFELKKQRGVIFLDTEGGFKI